MSKLNQNFTFPFEACFSSRPNWNLLPIQFNVIEFANFHKLAVLGVNPK